jgi:hypothetical protein
MTRELLPVEVLTDLLGEPGFEIADTQLGAVVILQRLRAAGFSVAPTVAATLTLLAAVAADNPETFRND